MYIVFLTYIYVRYKICMNYTAPIKFWSKIFLNFAKKCPGVAFFYWAVLNDAAESTDYVGLIDR